mmetsp:Transcript_22490/g.45536  ORF Transcript_22490/g.45536 Transcript_22490/m.45536 type:complete len:179 (-) Transcript_22490:254-790(-)|eukprot:CAMPEP_0183291082 /NCGR_PEP_ID=MMETSP0160_2-20130417/627_1 /TAXON_ID=2839 ORGANISM="Odontella Sinensis, Strain Grunow 1884" /NCGR_SAMPLE_ID=MMETSP0160_2 /ASSEMBLY_ACC=CAM_ASM_000250 /LENGTH=178 /DNA_ID=CAMNT_0025451837 /DNA_START=108 /DNA_END=644 /DNA_ORIENTATION=-
MVRLATAPLALFLIISGAAAGRLNDPMERNEDNFGMRRDGNGPTKDSLGMTKEERDRIAMCAQSEEPILFKTSGELGEAQKVLMALAEDLNKLALAVKTQVLLQTEEMAIGLDDVEALDEGRADPNDPDIKEELDNLEVEYKEHGGKVMSDLNTIQDMATCIEKGLGAVMGSVEKRRR